MTADQHSSLDAQLRALSARIDFPLTPDLAASVGRRLREGVVAVPARRRTRWWSEPRVAGFAAALVTVLALVLLVSPTAREAVASIFRGVRGIRVVVDEGLPSAGPAPSVSSSSATQVLSSPGIPSPTTAPSTAVPQASMTVPTGGVSTPAPSPSSLEIAATSPTIPGVRTTLTAARAALPFAPLLPAELGPPDRVLLEKSVARGVLTIVWYARPGLPRAAGDIGAVLTEFKPAVRDNFPYWLKSGVTSGQLRDVQINGSQGHWIEGGHRLDFNIPDSDGWREVASSRIAANTLIWIQEGVTMRLETALPLDAAMGIAESVG